MKQNYLRFNLLSIVILFFMNTVDCQIYSSEKVFTYKFLTFKDGIKVDSGIMYLGSLGKKWPFNDNQWSINWTTNEEEMLKKIGSTGVIENEERVWIHPPRFNNFSILEYSPFPEIKKSNSDKVKWETELAIGKYWAREEYGLDKNKKIKHKFIVSDSIYEYRRMDNNILPCKLIHANSINLSPYSSSFLGLFNSDYGFVSLEFNNIDRTYMKFELIKVEEWNEFIKYRNPFLLD